MKRTTYDSQGGSGLLDHVGPLSTTITNWAQLERIAEIVVYTRRTISIYYDPGTETTLTREGRPQFIKQDTVSALQQNASISGNVPSSIDQERLEYTARNVPNAPDWTHSKGAFDELYTRRMW
ncbi:MAG: hypothetical protein V1790_05510 [Planctomycetota bacterium]